MALSALLPSAVDEGWSEQPQFEAAYEQVLGGGSLSIREALAQVDEGFLEFAPLLQMAAPTRSLVDFFSAE